MFSFEFTSSKHLDMLSLREKALDRLHTSLSVHTPFLSLFIRSLLLIRHIQE